MENNFAKYYPGKKLWPGQDVNGQGDSYICTIYQSARPNTKTTKIRVPTNKKIFNLQYYSAVAEKSKLSQSIGGEGGHLWFIDRPETQTC